MLPIASAHNVAAWSDRKVMGHSFLVQGAKAQERDISDTQDFGLEQRRTYVLPATAPVFEGFSFFFNA